MEASEQLLTSPQVSYRLGVSIRTVHRLAEAGTLPVAQRLPGPNGAFLFQPSDITEYERQREAEKDQPDLPAAATS